KIDITDWNLRFFILPYAQGIQLVDHYHEKPNTTISGKLFSLMKIGAAGASTTVMFDEAITISGDTKTGEVMRDVLKNLDIDWEEQLSKIVGDSLAHPIMHHAKKAIAFGKRSLESLTGNVSEYLHYESKQLPPAAAVEHFIEDVSKLRDDVDRLEARVQRLKTRKSA
ncbi:MAG: SCP2 sterol-binding domain-containing protein, partial [Coxiellaceae bacterium]|nr:SCP2 sterol-binding domain-containing protein [Coxiellaceae bacterium]